MRKKKICVVVASRANYGRIRSVLRAITRRSDLELQLVVGASALLYRFGSVVDLIEEDGYEVDARVYTVVEGENPTTMGKSVGLSIIELTTQFENLRPDVVLTVADRYETMATAIAASYMNIPVAHTQGGELTGSIDESVRHAITKLSHLHFPATELSKERLVSMGEDKQFVFNHGCPAMDEIADLDLSIGTDFFQSSGGGDPIDPSKPYIVVLQHPVTTEYGQDADNAKETLKAIAELDTQTVWLWPNVDAGSDDISKELRMFRERPRNFALRFYRNFSIENYAKLIFNSRCLVGNSSSGIREAAFLGVPSVNIGNRQLGRERGANVRDAENNAEAILAAIKSQMQVGQYEPDFRFGRGNAGELIAATLATSKPVIQKRMSY